VGNLILVEWEIKLLIRHLAQWKYRIGIMDEKISTMVNNMTEKFTYLNIKLNKDRNLSAVLNLTNRCRAQACSPSYINNIHASSKSRPMAAIGYRVARQTSFIDIGISSYIEQVVVCTVVRVAMQRIPKSSAPAV